MIYTNIAKRAERYFLEDEQDALLKGQTLKETLDWKNANRFQQGWGEQYHKKFNLAMEFLNICQEMEGQAVPPPPQAPPQVEEKVEPPPPPPPSEPERPRIVIKKKGQ